MAKKRKALVITLVSIIVILSVTCIISIVYNFNGGFYFSRVAEYAKILGEEQTININGEGAFATACNFSGTTLINDDIAQQINIKTETLSDPLYLRAKVEIVGVKQQDNIIFGYTNWLTQENSNYIFFNQQVLSNQQIGLCKYVRLGSNNKLESNLNYILIFIVEASKTSFI